MTDEQSPATGDRPAPPGSPPILIDMSQQPEVPAPEGDRHLPGSVILVRDDRPPAPTASEYRAAGYAVSEEVSGPVADDQAPGLVYADRAAPRGTVVLATEGPTEARSEPEVAAEDGGDESSSSEERQTTAEESVEAAGRQAAKADEPRSANPHDRRTTEGKAWDRGWRSVQAAD